MRMKMNTSLSGPTVNVAPGGVHVCSAAEAIRHYRAGHGTPTEDCAEVFKAALAEQEVLEAAALVSDDGAEGKLDAGEPAPVDSPAPDTGAEKMPAKPAKPARAKA